MDNRPPVWADRILNLICSDKYIDELQGDLYELYHRNSKLFGPKKANWKFIIGVFTAFRFYRLKQYKITNITYNAMGIFKMNLKLGYRQLRRNKLYTLANIFGLSVGMIVFISVYFWRESEYKTDQFHTKSKDTYLLTVKTDSTADLLRARYGGLANKIAPKYPEVQHFTDIADLNAYLNNPENDVKFKTSGIAAHPGFLSIFDFKLLESSGDSLLVDPNTIILTKNIAKKLFGMDNPIGKMIGLEINEAAAYKVIAVMEDIPSNSSFDFDFIVPQNQYHWNRMTFGFICLNTNTDIPAFKEKIKHEAHGIYANTTTNVIVDLFPLKEIYLNASFDWFSHGNKKQIEIISIVAILILLVAIVNYINLATAQASKRAREIGVKKINGAQRNGILFQFYLESFYMVFISGIIAVVFILLLKPQLFLLTGKSFAINFFQFEILMAAFAGLVIVTSIAGLYPAILLSSYKPINALKGGLLTTRNTFRKLSVVTQFSVCVGLLIATVVIQNQLNFMQSKELGFENESIVSFEFINDDLWAKDEEEWQQRLDKLDFIFNELGQSTTIAAVGRSEFPIYHYKMDCWGFDDNPEKKIPVIIGGANDDFTSLYDIKLVAGKFYDEKSESDSTNEKTPTELVINKSAANKLFGGDAIGKTLTMASWGEHKVIGVVEDFHFQHLSLPIEPLFLYGKGNMGSKPIVRFKKGKLKEGMEHVKNLHRKVNAQVPFSYEFLDQELGQIYDKDIAIARLMQWISLIAVFLACLGLFALSAFAVELRIKEIGIRKVIGASVQDLFLMLSGDFLKWLVLSLVIALPVSWFLMNGWLDNYANRIDLSWWIFAMASLIMIFVSWMTISYHTLKAAFTKPIEVIKDE